MAQVIKKAVFKTILWTLVGSLLVLSATLIALQTSYVQTKLAQKATDWVSEKSSFSISLEAVSVNWFDRLALENLEIRDQQDSLMLQTSELKINFDLFNLIENGNIYLQNIGLNKAQIHLIKNTPQKDFNINLFARELNQLNSTPKENKQPQAEAVFYLDGAELNETTLSFNDPEQDSLSGQFDYYHFTLKDLKGKLSKFRFHKGNVQMNIRHLEAYEPVSNLRIDTLRSRFSFSDTTMRFDRLLLVSGDSRLQDQLVMEYDNMQAFSDFNRKVRLKIKLANSILFSEDLSPFAPSLRKINDVVQINGKFDGTISNFSMNNFQFTFGSSSWIKGSAFVSGLPNINETFMDIQLRQTRLHPFDLSQYVPEAAFAEIVKFGVSRMSGSLQGFPTDFVARGELTTQIGDLVTDMNLKFPENDLPKYSGSLKTTALELGVLAENEELFQQIDFEGEISGEGFSLEEADLKMDALIEHLGVKGYPYHKIRTNARLTKELFEGYLLVNDPNLQVEIEGVVDLRDDLNKIDLNGDLNVARLKWLNLTEKEVMLKTKLKLDLVGLELDSIVGEAHIDSMWMVYNNRLLNIKNLDIISEKDSLNRLIKMNSEMFKLKAEGNFLFSNLFSDLQQTVKEYRLSFENNEQDIRDYYAQKDTSQAAEYDMNYEAELYDINPLLELFLPQAYVSKNTHLEGRFRNGFTSILSFYTKIDSLKYGEYKLDNLQADLSASKINDSTDVLAMAYLASDKQFIGSRQVSEKLSIDGVWNKGTIDFDTHLKQFKTPNEANLRGSLSFLKDTTVLEFTRSGLYVLDKNWQISEDNQIAFHHGKTAVDSFNIFHEEKKIKLNGLVSRDPTDSLTLELEDFEASLFNSLLDFQLQGNLNGQLVMKDLYDEQRLTNRLSATDFYINDFLLGDLYLINRWEQAQKHFDIDFWINRKAKKIVSVKGLYTPGEKENPLDLTAKFDSARLDVAEPFIAELFSGMKGMASGEVKVTGTPERPILEGQGTIRDGQARFNYLNTVYNFDGGLVFGPNEIGVRNMTLRDINQNQASLKGGIFHDGFQDFVLDLSAEMDNFRVLNTTAQENNLYYGNAQATGQMTILGSVNNLYVNVTATTNKNTRIYLPLESYSDVSVDQEEYIHFVNLQDSSVTQKLEASDDLDLSGIKLDFDLEITPEAYFELIFDLKAGDIIRGRGNGKLKLQIDTEGEFNMFGDYEFTEGGYNFTLQNIINKEFAIENGSRISWSGDPYTGQLDILATYTQMASIAPVMNYSRSGNNTGTDEAANPAIANRKYPVQVEMDIEGELLSPDIEFGIAIEEVPQNLEISPGVYLEDAIRNFQNQLEVNEQELKRQVFSLIILRKLSEKNSFSPGGGSAVSSLSEFVSNQFSYLVSQLDDNLEVDFNLNDMQNFNDMNFQLRMSYTMLDGRLRVTRDGGIADNNTAGNDANLGSIVGEWTVEYLITEDGKIRAKMYNRNNLNGINGANTNVTQAGFTNSAGVSVMHVQSFDNFGELFKFLKKKTKEQQTPQEPQIPEQQAIKEDED